MSDMMDDINKYAAIWDAAQEKGIFADAPKPVQSSSMEPEDIIEPRADFFGQYMSDDIDEPLNEVDTQYWAKVSRLADPSRYIDPLNEESVPDKAEIKKDAEDMSSAHNSIRRSNLGKDQEPRVTQNWGVGGKEHFQLEDLKVRLEKLESKLNSLESQGNSEEGAQNKIDAIKKQIDELSNSLNGNRWSHDG